MWISKKSTILSAMEIILLLCFSGLSLSSAAKWSYEGLAGPSYWHKLFPEACSGAYQSPIDLRPEQTVYDPNLKDFAIWYDPPRPDSKMYIKNNGHTVQVDLEGDFSVTNGGLQHVYKPVQFHFHWGHKSHHGSEHQIEGVASPIELHIVSFNHDLYSDVGEAVTEQGGLAVLGVMFEISEEDNPALADLVTAIKHIRDPETRTRISLPLMSLRDLLPKDITRYYRYNGSLTTPGCFESVIWTVFDTKQTISHRQLDEFRTLMQFKHRRSKTHHHNKGHNNNNNNNDNSGRHRRSLTRAQRKMERRAEDVLEELGIQGNDFQETVFKAQLMEKEQRQMMADMPHTDGHASDSHHKPSQNQEINKVEPTKVVEASKAEHSGPGSKVEYDTASVDPVSTITQITEEVHYEEVQESLVNNFRPVQPLNDRRVHRSFKLRQPIFAAEPEGHLGQSHSGDSPAAHGGGGTDSAGILSASLFTLLASCVLLFAL